MTDDLPPLPEPDTRLPMDGPPRYRADQMRAYAIAYGDARAAAAVARERERWRDAVMAELDENGQALAIIAAATRAGS